MASSEKYTIWCLCLGLSIVLWSYPGHCENLPPTVFVVTLVRNKAPVLPYFLTLLDQLTYPKERMALWIRSDHNSDDSIALMQRWLKERKHLYHVVDFKYDVSEEVFPDETSSKEWTQNRFEHVIHLREEGLMAARQSWADYVWFLDADALVIKNNVLQILMSHEKPIIAPLLRSTGLYANFWAGMNNDFYYLRTEDYKPILEGKKKGVFSVPMIHSCVLVDLRTKESRLLTFDPDALPGYNGPYDDIITFAISANKTGIGMNLVNDEVFGFIPPALNPAASNSEDQENFLSLRLLLSEPEGPVNVLPMFQDQITYPEPKEIPGIDKIYMINLERRPERRHRMEYCFRELGIAYKWVRAFDGKKLNESYIKDLGITEIPEFRCPYNNRPMTYGEIGCFLSHYAIWKDIIDNNYQTALIFEDDIHFESFFNFRLRSVVEEIDKLKLDWDLIYVGRKVLRDDEAYLPDSSLLVDVEYSYWTLSYFISQSGAQKLVEAEPLQKLLPVDEYLPIMFDKHPNDTWSRYYPKRNLKAFSVAPLFVNPTHYTGDKGYVSDTEMSSVVFSEKNQASTQNSVPQNSSAAIPSGSSSPLIPLPPQTYPSSYKEEL